MGVESLITDLRNLRNKSVNTIGDTQSTNVSTDLNLPITAQWLQYKQMEFRQTQYKERTKQLRTIAQEHCAFTSADVSKDEIVNMHAVLQRLSRLVEQKQLYDPQAKELEALRLTLEDGKSALNEALYKRQQFVVVTSDYTTLPDKMADSLISYLTHLKSAVKP